MSTPQAQTPPDIAEIYRRLQRGTGHEWVNEGNVKALIEMARTRGDTLTATLLEEWRAPCAPSTPPEPPSATN